MSGTKYVLHPGRVRSIRDGDVHYIGPRRLAYLYRVDFRRCVVAGRGVVVDGLIHLFPRANGNYTLEGCDD